MNRKPVKIAISGAAGQIAYSLLFRLANGELLGPDQPVALSLLDLPQTQEALKGVVMELEDCAFPLLARVEVSDDPKHAFRDVEYTMLVGSRPRGKGMERSDLLAANAAIFKSQGMALNEVASRHVKVLVVGNPANTNAYIAVKSAPDLAPESFSSMIRLDHNRAVSQIAKVVGCSNSAIKQMIVWGNHSPTMFPDYRFVTIGGKPMRHPDINEEWNRQKFIPVVAQRGTAVIEARGHSSAASAANAAIGQLRDWIRGTNGRWVSMGVPSDGSYGIPEGLVFGVPVRCTAGHYERVALLDLSAFARKKIDASIAELVAERDAISHLRIMEHRRKPSLLVFAVRDPNALDALHRARGQLATTVVFHPQHADVRCFIGSLRKVQATIPSPAPAMETTQRLDPVESGHILAVVQSCRRAPKA